MGLSTIFFINLGTSIAKATLKIWLKDSTFAQNISVDIAEMLGKKSEDVISQRKAERFFDRISEEIAGELEFIISSDKEKFTIEQKEKITLALTMLFENTKLSDEIIFENDLNSLKLYNHLKQTNIINEYKLTDLERTKFEDVLLEACNYIVEITSTLPSFSKNSTKELLKRETELIGLVKEVLEKIPTVRENSGEKEDDKYETEYCRLVALKLDSIELFGISLTNIKSRYNLSTAYINLSISHESLKNGVEEHYRTEEALSISTRLLVKGDPGSGKTTLLQWIAVTAIRKEFTGLLQDWNNYIPFFIRLRSYSDGNFPTPDKFIDTVAKNISSYMPKGWVNRKLGSEKCLILIDGVDELPPSIRDRAESWIIELTDEYPNSTFIVSSRPPAVDIDWLAQSGFDDLMIQPMSINDISKFIDHWYEAYKKGISDKGVDIGEYKKNLKQIISDISSIKNLASTPLLCAMLCALNIDRKTQIPKDRMDLYRIALETLLERRDTERFIKSDVTLSRAEKEILLQDIAYWLLLNDYSDCEISEAISRVEKSIHTIPHLKQHDHDLVFYELLERSGLLREPIMGRVNFIHKTFQEYLSAKKAIEENDIGMLIKRADSDQWREVIILAAGHGNVEQRDRLISGLLNSTGDQPIKSKFIAVACMETAIQLSPETSQHLKEASEKLFPPKTEQDARDLSSAGEEVIDYLKGFTQESDNVVNSCIKTLTWIGSNDSIDVISEYSKEANKAVTNTLLWAWEYFDQELYAEKVLRHSKIVGPIRLTDKTSLKGVDKLEDLETLEIYDCLINSISPLSKLSNLKKLTINDCGNLADINLLSNCINIEEFKLQRCNLIRSFEFLKELKQLKHLDLSNCNNFDKPELLSKLYNLETIDVSGCYGITNISTWSSLSNLKRLTLNEVSLVDSLPEEIRYNVEVI